jgi:hypothetical protein
MAPTLDPSGGPAEALPARGLIVRLWTVLLAALWGALSLHPDYGSDIFFHLMFGREVLRTHARVLTERWALPGMHERCAVPEWLWDIVAFASHRAWGWAGVAGLVVVIAVLAAWACCRLAASRARHGSVAAVIVVTACVSPLVLLRLQGRPDAAVMLLLPALLLLSDGLGAASVRARTSRAAAVLALVFLWAQIHPSFVLAPIFVAIAGGDRMVRVDRRLAAGLALGLVVVSLTSAQGAAVFAYTLRHSESYTVSHVVEWLPPTWDMLDPTRHLFLPLYAALWIAALTGFALRRRIPLRELLLALVGLLLIARGQRNFGMGGELLVPFAVLGIDVLLAGVPARFGLVWALASVLAAALLFVRVASTLDDSLGPLGAVGPAAGYFPARAAAVLARSPPGTRVMTSYDAGAPLAFWLDGHVRTSLDARTLLYFDDPEFAAARASWEDAGALDRAIRIYGFDAAVVERSQPVCDFFAARTDWEPIVVDAMQTTFARKGAGLGPPLLRLSPCGEERFTRDACEDGGGTLTRELDAAAGDPFVDYLRVEARIACWHDTLDADALVAWLPTRARSAGFRAERDGALAWILAHAGRVDEAVALVAPYVAQGSVRAASRVAWVLENRNDPRLRPMLERLIADQDETTIPRWVFALLANACAREDKLSCAATYGTFSAAKGEAQAAPALCAVAKRATDPVMRKEASLWLDALRKDPGKGGASTALLACP